MTDKTKCEECGKYSYIDEDDYLYGKPFCQNCLPFISYCRTCKKTFKINQRDKRGRSLCDKCKIDKPPWIERWLSLRFKTFQRDNFTCRYCGRSPLEDKNIILHCDHIVPRSKNGAFELDNLITACLECNLGKGDILLSERQISLFKHRQKQT